MACEDRFFVICGRQKPEDPQFEPIADDAITRAVYEVWDLPLVFTDLK